MHPESTPVEDVQLTATRVAKNTAGQLAALGSTIVSKLLITIVVARIFGPEQVGDLAFVTTFTLLFNFMSSAGVPWALIRETATHRNEVDLYVSNGLGLVSISGLLTVPVMVAVVAILGYPGSIQLAVALTGLALMFEGLGQVLNGVLSGLERMELGALILIVQELAFLVMGGVVLFLHLPFGWLFGVYIPSRLAGLITGLLLYRKLFGHMVWPRLQGRFGRELLQLSLPYALNVALGPVYLRVDVLMLSFFQGNVAAGYYEAATTIFNRLNVFARTLNNALLPLMAREFEADSTPAGRVNGILKYIHAAVKYQLVLGVPITVACVMLAERFIYLVYGPGFEASAVVFRVLTTIVCLQFIDNTLATALTAIGLQGRRTLAVGIAAIFNIAINLYAVPRYSFIGTAVTTVLTEGVFFGVLFATLSRRVRAEQRRAGHLLASGPFVKPVLAGLAMAAGLWGLGWLPLGLVALAGGVVYVIALVVLRVFTPAEMHVLLRISQLYRLAPQKLQRDLAQAGESVDLTHPAHPEG